MNIQASLDFLGLNHHKMPNAEKIWISNIQYSTNIPYRIFDWIYICDIIQIIEYSITFLGTYLPMQLCNIACQIASCVYVDHLWWSRAIPGHPGHVFIKYCTLILNIKRVCQWLKNHNICSISRLDLTIVLWTILLLPPETNQWWRRPFFIDILRFWSNKAKI